MNIRRGLFRLWLILSFLWIATLVTIFVIDEHLLEPNKTYEIEGRFKEKYVIVAPANATADEVVAFAEKNQRADCSEGKSGPWCNHPVKLEMSRKSFDLRVFYLALGIPTLAFLLGSGFYWAFAGFRRIP